MKDVFSTIIEQSRASQKLLLLWGLAFAVFSQILMLLALIVRFQALPNYTTSYDWFGNVWHIIQSTPSWRDILPIAAEEWLFEIGRMNHDYGIGISEWSLNVIPTRLVLLFMLGALCGLAYTLATGKQQACSLGSRFSAGTATGIGAVMIAMTNATMSWVVCCATPSWVVGLAMLGLGVSTSLALESLGPTLMFSGLLLLLAAIVFLAWQRTRRMSKHTVWEHQPHA